MRCMLLKTNGAQCSKYAQSELSVLMYTSHSDRKILDRVLKSKTFSFVVTVLA